MNLQVMFKVCMWNDLYGISVCFRAVLFNTDGIMYQDRDELWFNTYTCLEWNRLVLILMHIGLF